jgi:hypothetical protein
MEPRCGSFALMTTPARESALDRYGTDRTDPARTRVTSLEGASGQSVHAGCYAAGAGQGRMLPTVVDRE